MSNSKKVRVAVVGVGNCASSLVQGVQYYRNAQPDDFVPGLMHVNLGGYHIRDIEFSAAIDIDQNKVGKDLSEAIFAALNRHGIACGAATDQTNQNQTVCPSLTAPTALTASSRCRSSGPRCTAKAKSFITRWDTRRILFPASHA